MLLSLLLSACGLGSSPGTAEKTAPPAPAAPKEEGAFLLWYNAGKTTYKSLDGKTWTAAGALPADVHSWYISMTADRGGRLYAGSDLTKLATSGDGGATWQMLPTSPLPGDGTGEYGFVCGGAANELAAITSTGRAWHSTDAGQSWTALPRPTPEGAKGSGGGFTGGCAFSPDGKKLLVEGWYFDPAGPTIAVTSDLGQSWTKLANAGENVSTNGVSFVDGGIIYGQGGSYSPGKVSLLADGAAAWSHSEDLISTPPPEWALHAVASDGHKLVIDWQNPGKGKEGGAPPPSTIFVSTDGGKTFTPSIGPVATDPTPDTWDEYIAAGWWNGKTPSPLPAASAPAAAPAPVAAPTPPPEPVKAEAPKAEPAKQTKKAPAKPDASHKQGKSIGRDNDGKRKE